MTTEPTFFPPDAQMERIYRAWDAGIATGDISSIGNEALRRNAGRCTALTSRSRRRGSFLQRFDSFLRLFDRCRRVGRKNKHI